VHRLLLLRQLVRGGRSPPAAPSVPDSQKVWVYTDPQAQSKEYAEGRGSLTWLLQAQRRAARASRACHALTRCAQSLLPVNCGPGPLSSAGLPCQPVGTACAGWGSEACSAECTRHPASGWVPASGTLTAQSRPPSARCVARNHRQRVSGPSAAAEAPTLS